MRPAGKDACVVPGCTGSQVVEGEGGPGNDSLRGREIHKQMIPSALSLAGVEVIIILRITTAVL